MTYQELETKIHPETREEWATVYVKTPDRDYPELIASRVNGIWHTPYRAIARIIEKNGLDQLIESLKEHDTEIGEELARFILEVYL